MSRHRLKPAFICLAILFASFAMAEGDGQAETLGNTQFKVLTIPGQQAYSQWQRIKDEGEFTPIVLGGKDDLARVAAGLESTLSIGNSYSALQYAWGLNHPSSLRALQEGEWNNTLESQKARGEENIFAGIELEDEEPIGQWPATPQQNPGFLSLYDYETNKLYDEVHIVLLPIHDPAHAPAFLQFGGWNANPPPGYHVAALLSWQKRYGAVPVLITGDVIEVRVSRRPQTRDEAMELAREHFLYSEDIVLQGTGSISNLAASLMVSDWWYFWWD